MLQNTISLVQLLKVYKPLQSPQMLTLVFADVVLPITISKAIDYPHSTDEEDSPMSHS